MNVVSAFSFLGEVGGIPICGAVLITCVSNLRSYRDQSGEENK